MVYFRVTAYLTISAEDRDSVVEILHKTIDSLVTESGLAVFDSKVSSQTVCDVENAEETRKESNQP